jgi:hypothetical protein
MPLSICRLTRPILGLCAAAFAAPALAQTALNTIRLYAVSESHQLIAVSAADPQKITRSVTLYGLEPNEHILGIDYRVAYGVMFALGSSGRVFTVDVQSGALKPVGETPFALKLEGERFGFDFNPAADRIRIVSDSGQNLRAHPETGALVDFKPEADGMQPDGALAFHGDDANAGRAPHVIAAAYTYNNENEKLTTNFAIDGALGALLRQGSVEGLEPVVSPNTGQLSTVGALGVAAITDAHFDISDVTNTALAALTTRDAPTPTLYRIDLTTGQASVIGPIGNGEPLRGIAIEP